jgi:peptidoglycan-N-acetylglucosamine deacetylase
MRLFRPCFLTGWLYPDAIFRIKTTEKLLCLTFDDGPDPGSTPHLLDILDKHKIKAIFFCSGNAAVEYPLLIKQITEKNHLIGNHGFNHLNGWKSSLQKYIAEVSDSGPFTSFRLFRPPYGRLRPNQYRKLKGTYKIFFWDVMAYDFDSEFGSLKSLDILKKKIRPGSIIVLHDKVHSAANKILGEFIDFAVKQGYRFVITF